MIPEFLIYLSAYLGLLVVIFYSLSIFRRKKIKEPVFNEKNPQFISIIIPAFNEEKNIAATIKSALGIDYPRNKMEIIVVDDGSNDKTYQIAKKFVSKIVKVYTKKNGGKGTALNLGLKKAKGEFIFTMDADSLVTPDSAKYQIARFQDKKVMCVAPIVAIYKPRGILERVQQIEYLLGVFLREAFASLRAIHITPGAFSAYRKSFFVKYGGFDENNLVEDMEMALRIQSHDLLIENSTKSIVYTHPPKTFRPLLIQRRRWYVGLIRNLKDYKRLLFSKNHGALGLIVLPMALFAIFMSIILTTYYAVKSIIDVRRELLLLQSINFDFLSMFEFTKYTFSSFLFNFFSYPITIFMVVFIIITLGYMYYAKSKVKEHSNVKLSLPIFLVLYSFLFAFWWAVAFIYDMIYKDVNWR